MSKAFKLSYDIDPVGRSIRPLLGMVRNTRPSQLSSGQFWTLSNIIPTERGLQKRPGFGYSANGYQLSADDQPVIDIAEFWQTNGTQSAALLTSRYLYNLATYANPTGQYWTYTTGKCSVSSTTVTGFGTDWDTATNYLRAYDYIVLDADGSGDGPEEIEITSIDSHDSLTLTSAPSGTYTNTDHIEYGDCENASSPTLDGGTSGLSDCTWTRSAVQKKDGTYSWVLTKSAAAGVNPGVVYLTDNTTNTDMHGLTAGTTYYFSFWMFTDVATLTNATVKFQEYYGATWNDTLSFTVSAASTWELEGSSITVNAATTGVTIQVQIATAEDAGKLLYLDEISFVTNDVDYAIRRSFNIDEKFLLDSCVVDSKLVVVDYTRPPYAWDGSTFGLYSSNVTYVAAAVAFFGDRMWLGNTIESGSYYKQRIRWSSATDHTSFNAADYYDLPYQPGELKRIIPLGPLLAVYFEDAIYLGRPSNLANLPYAFTKVDTGRVGLSGPRAVASIPNGHIFVGQDDVYILTLQGLESLSSPVSLEMLKNCGNTYNIYVVHDPANDRVVFGIPEGSGYITKLWSYQYRTKQWSYDDVDATSLANPHLSLSLNWVDMTTPLLPADDWSVGMAIFANWADIGAAASERQMFRSNDGYVYQINNTGSDTGSSYTVEIVTGEMDFDFSYQEKTLTRVYLRLSDFPSQAITFTVSASRDLNSWTQLGNLTIAATEKEGKVDCIFSGSNIALKFTESSTADQYYITEIDLIIRPRGRQYVFS